MACGGDREQGGGWEVSEGFPERFQLFSGWHGKPSDPASAGV